MGIVNCLFCVYVILAVTTDNLEPGLSLVKKAILPDRMAANLVCKVYPAAGKTEITGLSPGLILSDLEEALYPSHCRNTSTISFSFEECDESFTGKIRTALESVTSICAKTVSEIEMKTSKRVKARISSLKKNSLVLNDGKNKVYLHDACNFKL